MATIGLPDSGDQFARLELVNLLGAVFVALNLARDSPQNVGFDRAVVQHFITPKLLLFTHSLVERFRYYNGKANCVFERIHC
jgi:hypothetical protein